MTEPMTLAGARERVEVALGLLDADGADQLVGAGEQPEEYGQLIQGVHGVMAMLWAMLKMHGLKQNPASLKAHAQALLMVATIVHYAYALGVKRGMEAREDARRGTRSGSEPPD